MLVISYQCRATFCLYSSIQLSSCSLHIRNTDGIIHFDSAFVFLHRSNIHLIALLEEAEDCAPVNGEGVSEVLYAKFKAHFPDVTIGRPDRFYSTASRIIAPTRPSLRGPCKMSDEDLVAYKSKKWVPRIRKGIKSCMFDDFKKC